MLPPGGCIAYARVRSSTVVSVPFLLVDRNMPQGRHKVPFSSKQKKAQLQLKRNKKKENDGDSGSAQNFFKANTTKGRELCSDESDDGLSHSRHSQPVRTSNNRKRFDANRYRLYFHQETKEELEKRKQLAYEPIKSVSEETLEIDLDEIFLPGSVLDMPKRPEWSYQMSKEQVDAQENRYFREYLAAIEKDFPLQDLSYFELNLETWRQLWRVLEMSDVIFIIVDIRFPVLLFSPALYDHVNGELKKDVVLILNKIDLVPPSLVIAWKYYFKERFPSLHVICFTSFPKRGVNEAAKKRKFRKLRMSVDGALQLYEVCDSVVAGKVDLSNWRQKILSEMEEDAEAEDDCEVNIGHTTNEVPMTNYEAYERFKDQVLTIGCIGQPNVGKSSVINALVGKKVVSVSRTPGHTKHFQTIFLTNNVRLCDCPGLVFPSKVPKSLQVLAGSYPIAQLKEPFSSVYYLGMHTHLPRVLNLRHPELEGNLSGINLSWSAFNVCDAYAEKRGFKTAKAARNDTYRAANNILRLALEGRLYFCLRPPGYNQNKDKWEIHEDVEAILKIIARKSDVEVVEKDEPFESEGDSSEGDDEFSDLAQSQDGGAGKSLGSISNDNKFALLMEDD